MGYLGVAFSDLPNQGRNLRLYTYDPVGSQFNPTGAGNIYNTGHYDVTLPGGPCSASDPQGFQTPEAMNAYAGGRGETLVLVNRTDLTSLCSYRAPTSGLPSAPVTAQTIYAPPQIITTGPGTAAGSALTIPSGSAASIMQAQQASPTPGISPSAPIDTGQPQEAPQPPSAPDNTLLYAGLGLIALLLLSGRRSTA